MNAIEPGADEIRDVADCRCHFRPLADFEHLERHDAADLGAACGRHMGESVLLEPAGAALGHDAAGNRIEAAGDALARHQHIRLDAVFADGPHHAGAHEAGLHLVGDVKRVETLAELLDGRQVSLVRHREAVGGRDRLHDDGGNVAPAQRVFHGVEIVERDVNEFALGVLRQEDLRKSFGAGLDGEPGMAVIGAHDRDDLALLRRVPCRLDRDVDRLSTASAVDSVLQIARAAFGERFSERRSRQRRKMMIAHIEPLRRGAHDGNEFRIAMAEIVSSAVEMDVDQAAAVHVVKEVTLTPIDHQIDAHILPGLGLPRVPELL